MATQYIYLSGTAMWPKLKTPDTKFDTEGIFSLDLILDDASIAKFKASGIRVDLRTDAEGKKFVKIKRNNKKLIKGEVKTLGPPKVLDKEGQPLPENIIVGNGSKVTCKVAVFDTMKGKGHTLEAVRVDDLIQYMRDIDDTKEGAPF